MNDDERWDALERAEYAEMHDDRMRDEIEALRARIRDLENRYAGALRHAKILRAQLDDTEGRLTVLEERNDLLDNAVRSALVAMKNSEFTNAECLNAAHGILSRAIAH